MVNIKFPSDNLPLVSDVFGEGIHAAEVFSLPNGLTGYAIAEPGKTLSKAIQSAIFSALVPVTSSSFAADMTPYWALRREQDYFGRLAEFVVIEDGNGRMVGWTGYSVIHGAVTNLYIDSTGMAPGGQSRGTMREVLRTRLVGNAVQKQSRNERIYISARSESPIFYKLLRGLVGAENVYPSPVAATSAEVLACGRDLAAWLGQTDILEPGTLVLRGAYAMLDELYDELPSTGDAQLDQLFRHQLGPLDAYLLIGCINPPA